MIEEEKCEDLQRCCQRSKNWGNLPYNEMIWAYLVEFLKL
jgi:hypothetical protein